MNLDPNKVPVYRLVRLAEVLIDKEGEAVLGSDPPMRRLPRSNDGIGSSFQLSYHLTGSGPEKKLEIEYKQELVYAALIKGQRWFDEPEKNFVPISKKAPYGDWPADLIALAGEHEVGDK